ncbi:DJ-1/PfpI family protein [Vibrio mediterranei]|uniref:AraC family transcriptional regulator n=1 Tax=Vibrio mediterranei TaxID=689 RepID=A0ABX5DDF3_9VIBR|nr:DJ-1/PfpI family protein [Vibrio mediterranei]PCD88067.1 AraC family transcriptional regulator [Vibrio mediterranei]PRQ67734.1 AraC family transcriptional regulator [Vibrio mediterranei]
MDIAILTFDGFNELDSFIASAILNRMKPHGWNVQITCPTDVVTSMNGVEVVAQQPLEFANQADAVLFGSGMLTRQIATDQTILSRLSLEPNRQIIGAQCSGTLLLAALDLLNGVSACTDLTTKPWVQDLGIEVLEQPLHAHHNVATSGGCMSSQYLAAWVIAKLADREQAESAIYYVAPVGEKEETIRHCMSVIEAYL